MIDGMHKNPYDDRYKAVFAAGALHWNDPRPNAGLLRVLSRLPSGSECIEFGCGEGYQAFLVSSLGHSVTAIDLSPTAIDRARRKATLDSRVWFSVGDVTDPPSLKLFDSKYDLAVDIGCLHMIVNDEDRARYLSLVRRVLKIGGMLFLQDGLDLNDVVPRSDDDARRLAEAKMAQKGSPGVPLPRTIITAEGPKEMLFPLISAKMLSLDGYVSKLERAGLTIISSARTEGVNCSYEAVIVAERH
jgi:SAM-dependent methyltransferase